MINVSEKETKNRSAKNIIKKVLNIIEWIVLICAIVLLVYIFSSTFSGKAASLLSILNVCHAGDSFLSTGTIYLICRYSRKTKTSSEV